MANPEQERRRALDDLFSLVYEELRKLASSLRRHELHATLSTTALVHEAWMKLKDSPHLGTNSAPHFKAIAARAMRQILVEEARRRGARKRGGGGEASFVTLHDFADGAAADAAEMLVLDQALQQLALMSPRQAEIIECRYFGGLSVIETAAVLNVSESVVERDCRAAKAWLAAQVRPGKE